MTIEVQIHDPVNGDVETHELIPKSRFVWNDDPHFLGKIGWFIPEYDRPATLYVYTNDSVRQPDPADLAQWNGPVEGGLVFDEHALSDEPFLGEMWGRVMFFVEEGTKR